MSDQSSEFAIQPILCTHDIERLSSFYTELFGAEEEMRVPGNKGPFFVSLRLGGAGLGLVDYKRGAKAAPGRVTVAVFVKNVDADVIATATWICGSIRHQPVVQVLFPPWPPRRWKIISLRRPRRQLVRGTARRPAERNPERDLSA